MSSVSPLHTSPYPETSIYNRMFWIAYIANVCLVSANSLTFRFAELIDYLGGSEEVAGQIISFAVIMALGGRLILGPMIDRFSLRSVWVAASTVFVLGSLIILCVQTLDWTIYLGRSLFAIGLSGMLTCSVFHIQNQAPDHRRTEIIGSLGSSGFVGMIVGSQLGDLILGLVSNEAVQYRVLFACPLVMGAIYFCLVFFLTNRVSTETKREHIPFSFSKLWEQWPGWILLVSWTMGVCFTVISLFLTRYATQIGLKGVGTYFTSYALAALFFRLISRDWSRSLGRHKMVLIGLAAHSIGYSLLPSITEEWHFIIPALFSGFGHAILFPAVVSLGTGSFRKEWRGLGTNIVLGGFDVGAVTSAPILGAIIVWGGPTGFQTIFYLCSGLALGTATFYALTAARNPDEDLLFGKELNRPEPVIPDPVVDFLEQPESDLPLQPETACSCSK